MLPLSAAAYSEAPQECLDKTVEGAKASYFAGSLYQGSNNPAQMVIEIQESMFQAKVDFKDGGQVSKYFNDAFKSVWYAGLEEELLYLMTTYATYDLWTNHPDDLSIVRSLDIPSVAP
ncbi:hypothetical protein PRIPAC_95560 [Pristionchus pacificus]|uniref:Lipase n=1 Tax=Pristionchus pacificus TaxID=54126 RepID=A0A2A6D2C3_PRIPA|nr:hypothetical protein PRIPAC_95560 [Pristionchus pacificus]|eukprot:PDM84548.1 lipase [Pristionchus pacificus]